MLVYVLLSAYLFFQDALLEVELLGHKSRHILRYLIHTDKMALLIYPLGL